MHELEQFHNLYDLFDDLKSHGTMDQTLWRLFHCACCREIWAHLDDTMRSVVAAAELYAGQQLSKNDLRIAYEKAHAIETDAWHVVESLRERRIPSEWIWPVSEAVDDAWVRFSAASAAKTCALDATDEILFSTIPDSASSVPAWFNARKEIMQRNRSYQFAELRDLAKERWEKIQLEQEKKQMNILRSLVEKRWQYSDSVRKP